VQGSRAALLMLVAGVLTFGTVFSFLQFSPSRAEPDQTEVTPPPSSTAVIAVATDSLARRIDAGDLAVGVPLGGSEALLRNVQPGDRLDIVANLVSPTDGQPLTAVVVRGATVLQPLSGSDPLLVEVAAPQAIMLAHLVMNGTHLGYLLWPAGATPADATPPPLDDRTLRDALGLQPTPAPTLVPVTPTGVSTQEPAPLATLQAAPGSGFLYLVQPNDTWDSIATTFGRSVDQLRQWNEALDGDPVPGSLVFIPRS
jgi:LysM domain